MIKSEIVNKYIFSIIILLILFFVGFTSLDRSLWIDEAMIFVNISEVEFSDILQPLPYYTQASPVLPFALQSLTSSIDSTGFFSLRLYTLLFSFFCICIFILQLPKKILPHIWLLILTLSTIPFLYYSTEIKHYAFEFASSLFLIISFFSYLKKESKSAFIYSIISLLLGFSNIIPFGIMLFLVLYFEIKDNKKDFSYYKYFIVSFLGLITSYSYMKYLTENQISSHDVYISQGIISDTITLLYSVIGAHGIYLILLTAIALVYGLLSNKESLYHKFSLFYLGIVFSVFVLKILSLYPIISSRHVYWLLPFSVTLSAFLFQHIIDNFKKPRIYIYIIFIFIFCYNSYVFIKTEEITANNSLINEINVICDINSVNIITPDWSSRVTSAYKSEIKKGCEVNTTPIKSIDQENDYRADFLENLALFEDGSENYLVLSHIDVKKDYPYNDNGYYEFKKLLSDKGLSYKIYFYDKNVAILYIYK